MDDVKLIMTRNIKKIYRGLDGIFKVITNDEAIMKCLKLKDGGINWYIAAKARFSSYASM